MKYFLKLLLLPYKNGTSSYGYSKTMKNRLLYECIHFGLFWNKDDNIFGMYAHTVHSVLNHTGINHNLEAV